jgi:hypothetical protein
MAPTPALAAQMLDGLSRAFDGRPPPSVKRLHLPPVPWTGSKDGEFGALELDSRRAGPELPAAG